MRSVKRFYDNQSGATAVEYGLIASLVFVVACGAMTTFGDKTSGLMQTVSDAIAAAIGG